MIYNFSVENKIRLDEFLRENLPNCVKNQEISNSKIRRLIIAGSVFVNNSQIRRPAYIVFPKSKISVNFDENKFFYEKQPDDIKYEVTQKDVLFEDEYLIVDFDGKKTRYDFDELDQLEHAYAVTVHKSQGSEFDAVIIPLYVCFEKLFNRNLIYTAMTRAKRLLIFIGRRSVIDYMIDNTNEKARTTGLKYKIEILM